MTWFRVDDGFPGSAKVERLQERYPEHIYTAAITVWVLMGADCGLRLSDGVFSRARTSKVTNVSSRILEPALKALVAVGLTEVHPEGWRFHDWQSWNRTKAEVLADREAVKRRVGRHRNAVGNAVGNAVTVSVTPTTVTLLPTRPVRGGSEPPPDSEAEPCPPGPSESRPLEGASARTDPPSQRDPGPDGKPDPEEAPAPVSKPVPVLLNFRRLNAVKRRAADLEVEFSSTRRWLSPEERAQVAHDIAEREVT